MRAKYRHVSIEMTRHGRTAVYYRKGKSSRIRLHGEMGSDEFDIAYHAALAEQPVPDVRDLPVTPIVRRKQLTEKTLVGCLRSCRTRSRQRNLAFDLDLDFLLGMATNQGFRCALTGIEFFARNDLKSRVNPYTPSIDRIEPALGYVKGNVRLVTYAVNAMLLDWGEDFFHQMANSYRYWKIKKRTTSARTKWVAVRDEAKKR